MEYNSAFQLPFIYGAQYYRAPTPASSHWSSDLRRMAASGFNSVKYWVQWRWAHRAPTRFFFEDIDELMELAAINGLQVTLNLILDVAPTWLYQVYPDCRMVRSDGLILELQTAPCRQIGGYPGPCFNHGHAWEARATFIQHVVSRYKSHRALGMWDVWNEPESNIFLRNPRQETLLCYCSNCQRKFVDWLRRKYVKIEALNCVWGRCYESWDDVELPRHSETFSDMLDWRQFQLDSLANEAISRINAVKSLDDGHPVYLHPVPNTLDPFNSITGVDDFQIASGCDCFGATINGGPESPLQAVSAANGRVCYNVESHLRAGRTGLYPRTLTLDDFASEFIPQIGLGIRGFMHWQYRCETLGAESPGWGLLEPDGTAGPTHAASVEFWKCLRPIAHRLIDASLEPPQIAIYKSGENEIFHWCVHGNTNELRESISGFTNYCYKSNMRLIYTNDSALKHDRIPPSVRLLILPMVWCLDRMTSEAILSWVGQGGTLFCEGLTGLFDRDTGRMSEVLPGLGMSDYFGIREASPTAAFHLGDDRWLKRASDGVHGDLSKLLRAHDAKDHRPHMLCDGSEGHIEIRGQFAEIEGASTRSIAKLDGRMPSIVHKKVGDGNVFYCATQLGWQLNHEQMSGPNSIMQQVFSVARTEPRSSTHGGNIRIDRLTTRDGCALAVTNLGSTRTYVRFDSDEQLVGLFSRINFVNKMPFDCRQAELFVPIHWLGADGDQNLAQRLPSLFHASRRPKLCS